MSIVSAMVPDHRFGTGSWLKPNSCPISFPVCEYTQTDILGKVRPKSPNPYELGQLSAGCPSGPSLDSYNAIVFAVW